MLVIFDCDGVLVDSEGISNEVPSGKPHPDLFLHAAASLRAEAETCTVVEDSVSGVRAAVVASMRAIGYAAGITDARALIDAGAEPISSLTDLPRLLRLR